MSASDPVNRGWIEKFRDAFRGVMIGVQGQSSFRVHIVFAGLVVVAAAALRLGLLPWCALLLCITTVLVAEMFNSALERLAKAIRREYDPMIRDALDIASAAVLVAAVGAAIVGATIFVYQGATIFHLGGS
jgi:diacylglycerol kinase